MKTLSQVTQRDFFKALYEISQVITSIREIDPLLEKVMDIAIEVLEAERGFLLLRVADHAEEFEARVARNMSRETLADIRQISSSVVSQVLQKGEPLLSYDALEDERFRGAESILLHKIRSVACVPLSVKDRVIGAIYVDSLRRRGKFTEDSLRFLSAFASQAAIAIENARLYEALREENRRLREEVQRPYSLEGIVGKSPKMQEIFDLLPSVSRSDAAVLIEGESGTGKEVIARAIHANSPRKDKAFVALFCGSLPESLLESELFGHKKGAFTGALQDKPGLFEAAHKGTFFLDEVAELSPSIQTKLLRVLQEGEIKRVGENVIRKVDVRIISATNKNLAEEVKKGKFREDLYYRLKVITIRMPPLRERRSDIPLLAEHFLKKHLSKTEKKILGFSRAAMEVMMRYPWPGNVRELENAVERAVVLARGEWIEPEDLGLEEVEDLFEPGLTLKEFERRYVLKTLEEVEGNISKAARILGVSRRWLHYRLKEWKS